MEVSLGQIYASFNLLNKVVDQTLPVRLAFRFTRLIRELNKEYTSLETLRDGLVKKYGEAVEGQEGAFRVSEEHRDEFVADFKDLLDEKVDIAWELLSIEAPGLETLSLSVRELNTLGWLFTEFKELADEAAAEVVAAAVEADLDEESTETAEATATEAPAAEAEATVEEPAEVG